MSDARSRYSATYNSLTGQYPHQTASGRREQLRMNNRISPPSNQHAMTESVKKGSNDPAIRVSAEPTLDDSQLLGSGDLLHPPRFSEDSYARHVPLPASRPQSPSHCVDPRPHSSRDKDVSPRVLPKPHSELDLFSSAGRRLPASDPSTSSNQNDVQILTRTSSINHSGSINQIIGRKQSPIHHPSSSVPNFPFSATSQPSSPDKMNDPYFAMDDRSSGDHSDFSQETSATSINTLYPLQTKGPDNSDLHDFEPLAEDDPRSFDLVEPAQETGNVGIYALEKQSDLLLSNEHLSAIFANSKLLLKFTGFLNSHRPASIPLLIYYLDALKAIRAVKYSNAIAESLEPIKGCDFTKDSVRPSINRALEEKAYKAFEILVREDLPAYIAYTWIQVVSTSIQRRINGTLAPHLREASEGLAEVFCLTDPSRHDNPIVFASEEFARTTQYGMTYAIGRNCRFLQGPKTSKSAVRRLAESCIAGRENNEVFVNYRRDGSPFMNLLMTAPLMDSRGTVRYYIGAQVDVSGLLKSCSELPALADLVERQMYAGKADAENKDEFQELCEMFNGTELKTVRKSGGKMHKEYVDDADAESFHSDRPRRVLLQDSSQDLLDEQLEHVSSSVLAAVKERINGKLSGVYQNYLLIRPAPSLRILFTSPSLRVPGILQSPFLNRIGGSPRVRSDLAAALGEGRGVTAKIRWLARPDEDGDGDGRPRWIHCTPLLGHSGAVGVWMVVLVDEEGSREQIGSNRRFRAAPPVASTIGGKEWTRGREQEDRERRHLNAYDVEPQRRGVSPTPSNSASLYIPQPVASKLGSRATSRDRAGSSNISAQPPAQGKSHTAQASAPAPPEFGSPSSSRAHSATRRTSHFPPANGHIPGLHTTGRPATVRTDTGTSRDFAFR